ncbi:MAG: autotransporter assembly complex family protein [Sedimenticolaceae bacterium]
MKQARLFLILLFALVFQARGEVAIKLSGSDDAALESNLRARLALDGEPCDAPKWRVQRLFKRAEKDFQPGFRALGYYRPTVEKKLEFDGDCWLASFDIDTGERVKIRERTVIVRGAASDDPQLQPLLAKLPLAEGAPLNHAKYEDIKTALRDFAAERGYLDFVLTKQELRVYPDQAVADIDIEADSGDRYRFGELKLSAQPLDDDLVRRLAKIREGEPYDARALVDLDRNLSDSGYFSSVEVRPQRDAAEDGEVPIDVQLEPAKRHSWRAGVGYATDTGPRISLGYENRYVNSRGHQFDAELRLSPVESGLGADYMIPGRNPHRETFNFGAALLHENTDSAVSDSATLMASQTLKYEVWTQTRFLELLHERSTVGDEDQTTATFLMPGIRFDGVDADNPLMTRRGYRVSLELRGAYDGLLSTASLLQLRASAKGIHRFGKAGRITGRVDVGSTLTDTIFDLPASLRFFAGGDNSVRGYKYQSLGPVDKNGEPEGGLHLITGSLEYEHPVKGDEWWAAAFVDAGNAFNGSNVDPKLGYGVGVRWYSVVGRLRLDFAIPNDKAYGDWRIHFGLGADL